MLPRLSMVKDCEEWIFFFVEVNKKVLYAVTEKDNEFWWVEPIEPWRKSD